MVIGKKSINFHIYFNVFNIKKVKSLISPSDASRRAKDLFVSLNCSSSLNNVDLLNCAQRVDPALILRSVYTYLPSLTYLQSLSGDTMFSSLTIDNIAFNQSVDLIIKSGQIKRCKIITGYNSDEFGLFLLLTRVINENNNYGYKGFKFNDFLKAINQLLYYYPNYPSRRSSNVDTEIVNAYFKIHQMPANLFSPVYLNYLNQMLSDFAFVCPSFQAAGIYSSLNLDAYVYEFKYRGAVSLLGNLTFLGKATHADELVYVFGLPLSNKVKRFKSCFYLS